MKLFYVGSQTEFALKGERFERLGDTVDLTPEEAVEVIRGGGMFATSEEFAIGKFTDEERRRYSLPGPRTKAPVEFLARLDAVREIVALKCNQLRAQQDAEHAANDAIAAIPPSDPIPAAAPAPVPASRPQPKPAPTEEVKN